MTVLAARRCAPGAGLAGVLLALLCQAPERALAQAASEELVVTATRNGRSALELAGNTARLDAERIALINPKHIHELGTQLAGTWISRGSGQEHLTAIRSPVLTGPGSCGSFLFLEDGIPIRPTGFCNVNELFEVPAEQASAMELLRGPANALYGSNGLHGLLNVILPEPTAQPGYRLSAEAGPNDFLRGTLLAGGSLGDSALVTGLVVDHDGGFREASDYRQAKGFVKYRAPLAGGSLELGLSGSWLDQETAGFIVGEDAYKDPTLRLTNPNPEAYRDADSQRLSARWSPAGNTPADGWDLRGYARRSRMDFLQHFLPGQPVEENGQHSAGLMLTRFSTWRGLAVTAGLDLELARGYLEETQENPEVGGAYPRPAGKHYDYEAWQFAAAPYAQLEIPLGERWQATLGLRFEYLMYDYDNRMLDGNTRDDGTACEPDGCLFNRPADRRDHFRNLAPKLALLYRVTPRLSAYGGYARGFRAPQATELYRLQALQSNTDLDSEALDSFELGLRWVDARLRLEAAGFWMEKEDYIFQESNRFNVSDGRSRHVGIEAQAEIATDRGWYGSLAATWAKQTYRFDRETLGETIESGKDIDTAPRTLGSLRLGYQAPAWLTELEWVHQGRYYLNAENSARYPGHDLLNWRASLDFRGGWSATLRVNNLTDEYYADRADFAFGNYRYFPGRDREAFIELAYATR